MIEDSSYFFKFEYMKWLMMDASQLIFIGGTEVEFGRL